MHRTLILPLDILLSLTGRPAPRVKHHGVILSLILLLKRTIQVLRMLLLMCTVAFLDLLSGIFEQKCRLSRLLERLRGFGLSDQHLVPGLVVLLLSLVLLVEQLIVARGRGAFLRHHSPIVWRHYCLLGC